LSKRTLAIIGGVVGVGVVSLLVLRELLKKPTATLMGGVFEIGKTAYTGPIIGAKVTIENIETGETFQGYTTSPYGLYKITGITPGTYRATASAPSYETSAVHIITLYLHVTNSFSFELIPVS